MKVGFDVRGREVSIEFGMGWSGFFFEWEIGRRHRGTDGEWLSPLERKELHPPRWWENGTISWSWKGSERTALMTRTRVWKDYGVAWVGARGLPWDAYWANATPEPLFKLPWRRKGTA